jgi:hypothetical protein
VRTPRPLASRVADAFVDREPIAWSAARDSAPTADERARIDQFHALERLRTTSSPAPPPAPAAPGSHIWLTRLACGQLAAMACAGAVIAFGFDAVRSIPSAKLLLVAAFALSASVLAAAHVKTLRVTALINVFLACAVAFARPVLGALVRSVPAGWPQSVTAITAAVYPEAFLGAELWTFALYFPSVARWTPFDRFGRLVAKWLWVLGAVLFVVNLAGRGPLVRTTPWLDLLRRDHPGNVFWFLQAAALCGAVAAIAWRSGRAEPEERRRVRRFGLALAAGTAPFLGVAMSGIASAMLGGWFADAHLADRAAVDAVVLSGLALAPIAMAAAVVIDRALDVRLVVHRVTQYALTRRLLTVLVAAPIAGLLALLYAERQLSIAEIVSGPRGRILVFSAAAAVLLSLVRRRLRAGIDRLFAREAMDHRVEFNAALERARNARGFRELVFTVSRELEKVLAPAFVSIVRLEPAPAAVLSGASIFWLAGSAVECVMRDVDGCLDVSPSSWMATRMPPRQREWLQTAGVDAVAPVRRRDGTLLAVIAVGAKRNGMPLSNDERWLVGALATLVAVAWPEGQFALDDVSVECPRCGMIAPALTLTCQCGVAPHPTALPMVLNQKFALRRCLGRGGMGVVYLAHDLKLGRDVAVKTLPAASAAAIARLRTEARAMASLSHAGLAMIHGLEVWQSTPALIVEYCPGGTLDARLRRGRLSLAEACELGDRLLDALSYMHAHHITHRDVKPSNIGLAADGRVKLLDFGLSAAGTATSSASHASAIGDKTSGIAGTPLYMPPESFAGQGSAVHRDLWAAALVLYEALAGRHPFGPAGPAANLPPALVSFFERSLAQRPEDRFQTADEQRDALRDATRKPRIVGRTHAETAGGSSLEGMLPGDGGGLSDGDRQTGH